jgi:hypothetical protein
VTTPHQRSLGQCGTLTYSHFTMSATVLTPGTGRLHVSRDTPAGFATGAPEQSPLKYVLAVQGDLASPVLQTTRTEGENGRLLSLIFRQAPLRMGAGLPAPLHEPELKPTIEMVPLYMGRTTGTVPVPVLLPLPLPEAECCPLPVPVPEAEAEAEALWAVPVAVAVLVCAPAVPVPDEVAVCDVDEFVGSEPLRHEVSRREERT